LTCVSVWSFEWAAIRHPLSAIGPGAAMPERRLLSGILALAALGVAATGILISSRPPARSRGSVPPYYKRTGFLSNLMQELNTSAKGIDSIHLPDGFEASVAAGPGMVTYPMFIAFDDRGRLFVCESAGRNISDQEMDRQYEMRIRLLEDTDGDGVFDRGTVFADKISMTMGAQWYRGSLYVAAPPDELRFSDTDGDGVADRREVVLTGWPLHSNGTTLHGPYLGPDGWMYLTYNLGKYEIKTKEGATLRGPGGRVFRFRPDGSGLEWIIGGGYDNGIEMVFTPAGEMFGTMTYYTNPKLGERDALLHYVEGGVYPKVQPIVNQYKRTGDLMPAMTKFARIAPSGLALYRGSSFGAGYEGNLFSAQFNPHRIQRHIVERTGATFRTADEDFLTSDDPDFHPTDVTEDADGSLLVVETGAWYLHSCPVSRIAKPEFKGALYRVRRKGAPRVRDGWGNALKMEGRRPEELSSLLGDARPSVRDRAADLLVSAGEASVDALIRVRETHASPETRAAAVFALARIGRGKAAEAARAALGDSHFIPRIAAARMAGMARDREAVPRLMEMVEKDEPPARRQAATALGQIGDRRAVPALIAASAHPVDRFLEHSIIYSLITLRTPEPLLEALRSRAPGTRKAALIALDQMDNSPLERGQLRSALGDPDGDLRRAALWVASRHPEWAGEALGVIRARLRGSDLPDDEAEAVRQTLVSFCGKPDGQRMMADLLGDPTAPSRQQIFLLDAMDKCPAPAFPAVWNAELRRRLSSQDAAVRARVMALARARQLAGLDDELDRIAGDEHESPDLRTAAIGVLVARRPALSDSRFRFLSAQLQPDTNADLRQTASQILGRARLNDAQLLRLAQERLPHADPLILPNLLDSFRAAASEQTGKAMVEGLLASSQPADGIAAERIPELLNHFPQPVRTAAQPLLARIEKEKQSRAARLESLEPLLKGGDIDRGREVFFGAKAGCSSCHTIMAQGGDVGPDLTGVGAIRSGIDLLEAVVYPSASFVPGHEVYRVETASEVYTGVQGEGTPDAVTIISGPRDRVRIPRKEIRLMRPSTVSLMPDGFADNLTRQELSNLLAFLQAQKSREADAKFARNAP
jgi:putative membrane-bound dehydrogenase-like protein